MSEVVEVVGRDDFGYESPITLMTKKIVEDITEKQNGYIVEECIKMGVIVDKEELLKALRYDRGQYEKGYLAGFIARSEQIVRCRDCKHHEAEEPGMVWCPKIVGSWVSEDWFCADGERKERSEDE